MFCVLVESTGLFGVWAVCERRCIPHHKIYLNEHSLELLFFSHWHCLCLCLCVS